MTENKQQGSVDKERQAKKNYTRKYAKDFNILTKLYQVYALRVLFLPFASLFYSINLKKSCKKISYPCIVAPNHISYFDPFLVTFAAATGLAYMAKKELFEGKGFLGRYIAKNVSRLGAFSVNREKLEVSTIKSAKEVFKANFSLCIFPQGGIRKNKKVEAINKGFVVLAKMVKVDILPIALTGVEHYNWNIFKRKKINIQVGTPISYLEDEDVIIQNWRKQISDMSGYELVEC